MDSWHLVESSPKVPGVWAEGSQSVTTGTLPCILMGAYSKRTVSKL